MTAFELMTKEIVCAELETSVYEAAKLMTDFGVGELPVVRDYESRELEGVLTDRDIACRGVAPGRNVFALQAGQLMSSPAVCVTPEADLDLCVDVMRRNKIRRLPVVDGERRCIGIISQADIARMAPEKVGKMVKAVSLG